MIRMRMVFLLLLLLAAALAVLTLEPARAGGWAVVTLEELPAQVVAGQPFTVQFAVRQHGQRLLPGLSPTITAMRAATGARVTVQAAETYPKGIYVASMTLPAAGQWRWTIDAFTETYTMPPLTVTAAAATAAGLTTAAASLSWVVGVAGLAAAAGLAAVWRWQRRRVWLVGTAVALLVCLGAFAWQWSSPPALLAEGESSAAIAPEQMGEALFVAKGCIQCHQNGNVTMTANNFAFGPNLTYYNGSPEYLRLWLADPSSVKPETQMPDLGLSQADIETLVTFVTTQK